MAEAKKTAIPRTKDAPDFCSICWIAGTVKRSYAEQGRDSGMILVFVGDESKWIPCSVYQQPELMARLVKYRDGDAIKLVGYVRAWSKKDDKTGEWVQSVDVRITEIKSRDPERKQPEQSGMF